MQSLSPRWQRGSGCGDATGRHSWAHTMSPFPSNDGQGFPAAPCLRAGKAWQVKLGEGCWNPVASDLLSSEHQAAAFPSRFLPLHCMLQDEVSVCHLSPPGHLLVPSSTFTGQKRCRAAEGSGCLFKAGCWLLFHRAPPSLEDSLLPSLCWGQPCPVVLHTLLEGPPGKGNGKKALRGSRRGAERDLSPFSFTLSFL